jgi:hypothetical protein
MGRCTVGLLAALGAILSAFASLTHGDVTPLTMLGAGVATGFAAYMAMPGKKIPTESL